MARNRDGSRKTPTPQTPDRPSTATPRGNRRRRAAAVETKRVSLAQIFRDGKSVYVSFPGINGMPVGNIVLGHPDKNVRLPALPVGHVPVCLSDLVSDRQLQDCTDLRRLIANGRLRLWDPDEAEAFIDGNPDQVTAHEARIQELQQQAREIDPALKARIVAGSSDSLVNKRVQHLCLQVRENRAEPMGVLRQLMLMDEQGMLRETDFEYIRSHAKNFEICKWAQDVLDEVHEMEVEEGPTPHDVPARTNEGEEHDGFTSTLQSAIEHKRQNPGHLPVE